ncbi:hypothetical protein BST10_10070 [Mycolicibacter algericus DSM 45454]|uniref:Uncharacterized protein n=1 Tax=Mycolicibacter algericus DSM 45454 TaxID=723879 RepID=A0ABX3RSH4_MYCAL|nr:hypothetical protein BST10_10070 [Mycolicibacter algericus DSM 45454]
MAVWRQQPTAIEAELSDRGHDIADWHQGRMSSRKLLVLLEHSSENGPYRRAVSGGDWPTWMQMLKEIHKEAALSRASRYAGTRYEYQPQVFVSPVERAEQEAADAADDQFQADAYAKVLAQITGGRVA